MKAVLLFWALYLVPYHLLITTPYALGIISLGDSTEPLWRRFLFMVLLMIWTWVLFDQELFPTAN